MKITKTEAKLFKETHGKWLNESNFLAKFFVNRVKSALLNDKELKKAVEDADKRVEDVKDRIEKISGGDKELVKKSIPTDVRKFLGLDY